MRAVCLSAILAPLACAGTVADFQSIRPILVQNCGPCHNPAINPKSHVDFLKSETVGDMETRRGIWRDVAVQLRNRTMPPVATKLTEEERLGIVTWVEGHLRQTACNAGDYAGFVAPRRLNRREYHNSVRDLLGVDMDVAAVFPADESGGAGFDTNGETLFIPPALLEHYMEAAQKILDHVIVTPPLNRKFMAEEMTPPVAPVTRPGRPLTPGQEVSADVVVFAEGEYGLRVSIERPREIPVEMSVKVDGVAVGKQYYQRDSAGGPTARSTTATLARGPHTVTVAAGKLPVHFYSLTVEQQRPDPPREQRALHYQLFGMDPGEVPVDPRAAVHRLLARILPKAFRRPVDPKDVDRFLAIYDRAAHRGDPYEECVKLALKAVLVSPRFLFHVEDASPAPGIHPVGQYEMASRLSYFLWSTAPDDELYRLAEQNRLQDPKVLAAQAERMLDDPRSRAFASSFIGQWLGTQDVGGRAVPLLTELQYFYTPEIAADLREEPVLLFQYLLGANRSLLDLLDANYSFLNARLIKYYQLEGKVKPVSGDGFEKIEWPDNHRAGVLGLASVLAMTSHYRQSSPVLRGAWVLDTLLGTPVPPPPPDIPPLETAGKADAASSIRQALMKHRADRSCATCHNLMDPIGFGLENFDWMGRWRDREPDGKPIDASGVLPSGETFNGPVELRRLLLQRKEDFLRHLTGKVLGYALGRSLQDGDQCTIQRIVDKLDKENFQARTLIREIVSSVPFRYSQPDARPQPITVTQLPKQPRRLLGDK